MIVMYVTYNMSVFVRFFDNAIETVSFISFLFGSSNSFSFIEYEYEMFGIQHPRHSKYKEKYKKTYINK